MPTLAVLYMLFLPPQSVVSGSTVISGGAVLGVPDAALNILALGRSAASLNAFK